MLAHSRVRCGHNSHDQLTTPTPNQKSSSFVENENSFTEEEKAQAKPLRVTAHLNTAACNLKLKDYKACIENCDKVPFLDLSLVAPPAGELVSLLTRSLGRDVHKRR